jgi:hypothetical protein
MTDAPLQRPDRLAQVLACTRDRRVERITRNVLDGLLSR